MNKVSGFTLIEILIAMVILAVGLLGLAGLQATGLKNNQSAYYRSLATQLAYDMADRIRANIAEADKFDTSTYITVDPVDASAQDDCNEVSVNCTIADLAESDLFEWNAALAALPSVEASITTDAATRTFTITIAWDDRKDGAVDADDPSFQMSFQI